MAGSLQKQSKAPNQARAVYADYLKPVGGETSFTASAYGRSYYYRYYPSTDTYVGTKNGNAYLMESDKLIRDQGRLSGFTTIVRGAGF